jgi:hypothetical protein
MIAVGGNSIIRQRASGVESKGRNPALSPRENRQLGYAVALSGEVKRMPNVTKPIYLSGHARQQMQFRGAGEQEVGEAIRSEDWQPSGNGRFECHKDFPFNSSWNKKVYATKQVRPIFVEEANEIVVITVYVYYF